jgi:hypothetical protein
MGAVFVSMQGVRAVQGALQFAVGDMLNGLVKKRTFTSKGDAASAIKLAMSKIEGGKVFDIGTIQFYGNMAERIPSDKRLPNVNPSVYLAVSKATPPRIKSDNKEALATLDKDFSALRDDLLEKVNEGELVNADEVNKAINAFKTEKGIVKASANDAKKAQDKWLKQLFFAVWTKKNVVGVHKSDVAIFKQKVDDTEQELEVPVGELTDLEEEALNNLQNMLVKEDVTHIMKGYELVEDSKTKQKKKANFYMTYPFGSDEVKPEDETKQSASAKKEVEPEPEEEEEEETEEEV